MRNKIIATLGLVAIVAGLSLLCSNLAPVARYNGTTPLLVAMPFIVLYPLLGLLASKRKR